VAHAWIALTALLNRPTVARKNTRPMPVTAAKSRDTAANAAVVHGALFITNLCIADACADTN
jgi:hypothetical protein